VKKMLAGLLQLVSYLVVFGVIASLLAELLVPIEGPNYCKTAFRSAYPDLARESRVVRGVWTRTQGERWLSALVVQPMDITQSGPRLYVASPEPTTPTAQ
jgi:hypothetical protein